MEADSRESGFESRSDSATGGNPNQFAVLPADEVHVPLRERGGDYLLPAKDNQARLQADIRTALEDRAGVSPLPATAAA